MSDTGGGRLADVGATPPTVGRSDDAERRRRVAAFFFGLCGKSQATQPAKEWRDAWASYDESAGNPETDAELVNMWRAKVDSQAAFLAGEAPVLSVQPVGQHGGDDVAVIRAGLDQSAYRYIAREMGYLDTLERMRKSADITNVGAVAHRPDRAKWLPDIVYLEPEMVAIDPACGGDMKQAGWVGYWQYMSPDELSEDFRVPVEVFRAACERKGYDLNPSHGDKLERQDDRDDAAAIALRQCRVWRVFARGAYAMYDSPPHEAGTDDSESPAKFRAKDGYSERRRYVVLCEGLDAPLVDEADWPREFLLDAGEWPLTVLTHNTTRNSVWGFPDFRHERKLLRSLSVAVADMDSRQLAGLKLGLQDGAESNERPWRALLEKPGVQMLANAVDVSGNAKLRPLELPEVTNEDIAWFSLLLELYDQISLTPRTARGGEDPDKTATATQIEDDRATARANRRLRRYEDVISEIARKTIQMAHAMLPAVTEVSVGDGGLVQAVPWEQAEQMLMSGGVRLERLGLDAIAGVEDAPAWIEWDGESDSGPAALVLRSVRVQVERGSTQRAARVQKAEMFKQVFAEVVGPVAQSLGEQGIELMLEAAVRVLGVLGLDEFESVRDMLEGIADDMGAQRAAVAEAQQIAAGAGYAGESGMAVPIQ